MSPRGGPGGRGAAVPAGDGTPWVPSSGGAGEGQNWPENLVETLNTALGWLYQVIREEHQTTSLPQMKHVGKLNPKLGAPGVGETRRFCPWAVFPCLQPRSSNSHSKLCSQAPHSSSRAGALYVDAVAVRVSLPLGAEFCSSSNLPVLQSLSYGSGSSHQRQPPR